MDKINHSAHLKRSFDRFAISGISLLLLIVPAQLRAAPLQEARVTQVIKDVKLLPNEAAPRPAAVNDKINGKTAVRTGADSRTELTFSDFTIARLGANTIFSVDEGTRTIDLGGGAILVRVPKNSGGAKISTAAVTAAITGTTMMAEYHKDQFKFIMLEGSAQICRTGGGDCAEINPGQMLAGRPGQPLNKPVKIDLRSLTKTSKLMNSGFGSLGSEDLIEAAIAQQDAGNLLPVMPTDSTGLDAADQRTAATTPTPTPTPTMTVTPTPTPAPTPDKNGALVVITSDALSTIDGGTVMQTDPSITRMGETGYGRIYRGFADDGAASEYFFETSSGFDEAIGFDSTIGGDSYTPFAAFKFTNLTIAGDPTISTSNGGATSLALIGVNGISSGTDLSTLHFNGIRTLLLATENGSINLGSNLAFEDIPVLYVYARGVDSSLTFDSAVSGTTDLFLLSEGDLRATDSLVVSQTNGFQGGGLNLTLRAGHAINIGGDLDLTTDASDLDAGGNILVRSENDMTIGGTFRLLVSSNPDSITGTGGNITVYSGGNLSAGSLDFDLDFNDSGGVTEGVNLSLSIGGNLTTTTGGIDLILFTPIGHTLNRGGNLDLVVDGDLNSAGDVNLTVINTAATNVPDGANLNLSVGGNLDLGENALTAMVENEDNGGIVTGGNLTLNAGSLSAQSVFAQIDNTGGGHIITGGNLTFHVNGSLTTAGNAEFFLQNTGGTIGSAAALDLQAGSFVIGGSLNAYIDNRGGNIGTGGNDGVLTLQSDGAITVSNRLNVLGNITADGDVTAGTIASTNITSTGNIVAGQGGIMQFQFGDGAVLQTPHSLTAAHVLSLGGINFDGLPETSGSGPTDGGSLTINAQSLSFGAGQDIDGTISFNGGDALLTGQGPAGSGGIFTVVASGPITVASDLEATTGYQAPNSPASGNGGTIDLTSTDDTVTVNARIEVSSSSSATPVPRARASARGGNIRISSGKAGTAQNRAVAVDIGNSGQLLALLAAAPTPRPGGQIVIRATGANSDVNVGGRVQADGGLVDIRHTGVSGDINLDGGANRALDIRGDVVKVAALGDNGVLRIGGGSISADTTLQLYATGFNGEVRFISNVSLLGSSVKSIAGNAVTVLNGVNVNVGGPAATVYVNSTNGVPNANYNASIGGNGSTTGTFGGSGVNPVQPLGNAPPIGPAPRPGG